MTDSATMRVAPAPASVAHDIRRGAGVALWAQIADALRGEIAQGVLAPGEQLPPEPALAERFDVNRHTLRRAVAELAAEGVVNVVQGRGTFVAERVVDYRVRRRTRFTEIVAEQGLVPSGAVLNTARVRAEPGVAAALGLRSGTTVVVAEILRTVDGRPLSLSSHYFSARRFPDITDRIRETRSVTEALRRCGVADYARATTRVGARPPTATEARLLETPARIPLIVTEAVDVGPDGAPIAYGVARFAADRTRLLFET